MSIQLVVHFLVAAEVLLCENVTQTTEMEELRFWLNSGPAGQDNWIINSPRGYCSSFWGISAVSVWACSPFHLSSAYLVSLIRGLLGQVKIERPSFGNSPCHAPCLRMLISLRPGFYGYHIVKRHCRAGAVAFCGMSDNGLSLAITVLIIKRWGVYRVGGLFNNKTEETETGERGDDKGPQLLSELYFEAVTFQNHFST